LIKDWVAKFVEPNSIDQEFLESWQTFSFHQG